MNSADFDAQVKRRHEQRMRVLLLKEDEYAAAIGSDRLHNFNRAAGLLGCHPIEAAVGMWAKHLVSILDICDLVSNLGCVDSKMLDEKFNDTHNYLDLIEALIRVELGTELSGKEPSLSEPETSMPEKMPATKKKGHRGRRGRK